MDKKIKNYTMLAVIYVAVFAIYNVLVFLIFGDKNDCFWISYAFMCVAFLGNLGIVLYTTKSKNMEAVFLGIPLVSFSVFHIAAEFFVSIVFMLFRNVASVQLTVSIQVILLLIFIIFAAAAILSKNAVESVTQTVSTNVANIKNLSVDVQMLETQCLDPELKKQLHKVAEAIKFSDPMVNDSVAQLDEMIRSKVTELKYCCQNNEKNEAIQICFKLESYISERNKRLMLSK